MAQRIKGQEVSLSISGPQGKIQLDNIGSADLTLNLEMLTERYLGQTADDYDEIFNGISGTINAHLTNGQFFEFTDAIVDKAKRRGGETTFEVTFSYAFPNGERVRYVCQDVHFGEVPVSTGGRAEYVSVTLSFSAKTFTRTS